MTQRVASLEGAALNLIALREDCREELITLLTALPGRKCLVLDRALGGLLNHVIPEGAKLLREKGVVHVRQLGSGDLGLPQDPHTGKPELPEHVVYLVRPSVAHTKLIAMQVQDGVRAGVPLDYRYKVYFAPQRTLICEQVLRDEGVASRIDIADHPLDLIPLDTDLLSLELEGAVGAALLTSTGGASWGCDAGAGVTAVARSLIRLQAMYGAIPNVKAIGPNSAAALRLAMRTRREEYDPANPALGTSNVEIDTLIMLDRSVDLASPLVTPLTYEGLIDELLGIANGFVKLDAEALGEAEESSTAADLRKQVAVPLNSSDPLYAATRDLSVENLGPYLQGKAKDIRESYAAFRANKDQSITEIHDFVKRIPGLTQTYKSLNQHIHIAELVKRTTDGAPFRQRWQTERSMLEGEACFDAIEDLICEQAPLVSVLRLLCLQSITRGGIPSGRFDALRRDIVQTYGYETMHALAALEAAGLLKRGGLGWVVDTAAAAPWAALRRALRLLSDVTPAASSSSSASAAPPPQDMSYVCAGYAPLSARVVQAMAGGGGAGDLAAALRVLPTPVLDFKQQDADTRQQGSQEKKRPVLLVYYVGGVTFLEVAALRFLGRQRDFPFEVVVATTKILSGDAFVRTLMPSFDNGLAQD